ncbi:hypothetical protein [Elioraea sp.]|uniref:hypothetical protein n=1 Tax=Elioraea sp. TaxID=2185103 RepID=UPI003F70F2A0
MLLLAVLLAFMVSTYWVLKDVFALWGDETQRLALGRSRYLILIPAVFSFVALFPGWRVVRSYSGKFIVNRQEIIEELLLARNRLLWMDIKRVERIIQSDRNSTMRFIDRRGIRFVGPGGAIIAYEELDRFDELSRCATAECKSRGIPMSEKDSSWQVHWSWKGSKWKQVPGGEGWRRIFVERPIDEL